MTARAYILALGLLLCAFPQRSASQEGWTFRGYGGLGIGAAVMAPLADYANVLGGAGGEKIEDFQSLFDLNAGLEVQVVRGWSVGLDYTAASRTIQTNPSGTGPNWTFEPSIHMSTLMVRRLYGTSALSYGFGGGIGYHSGTLTVRPPGVVEGDVFTGSGPGVVLEAIAFTYFDTSLAGMVAVDARWSGISELTNAGGAQPRTGNGLVATLEMLSVSLRFGISYHL